MIQDIKNSTFFTFYPYKRKHSLRIFRDPTMYLKDKRNSKDFN